MILHGTFFSKYLGMDTNISLMIPQTYPDTGYSVAYLLHGLCGNNNTWLDYSMLADFARRSSCLFVMPDSARSYYTEPYFSYITKELPQACVSLFHVQADRAHTFVMGVSIGGYGALKCALTFPKQYGYCYAFSSACLFLNEGLANARKDKNLFCKNYGESIYQDFRQNFQLKDSEESDLLSVAQANKDTKSLITLYCGSKDPFLQDNRRFKDELQKLGYNPSYEEWEGSHDFIFFNEALRKAVAKAEMHE